MERCVACNAKYQNDCGKCEECGFDILDAFSQVKNSLIGRELIDFIVKIHRQERDFRLREELRNACKFKLPICSIEQVKPGIVITFGSCEWLVLLVQHDDTALIISRHIVEFRPYHDEYIKVTWEESYLRAYLNGAFLEKFSLEERECIISAPTLGEQNTGEEKDSIFLLSTQEIGQLPEFVAEHACAQEYKGKKHESWWLGNHDRGSSNSAAIMSADGKIIFDGSSVNEFSGVRPALWIKLR
jgi:hypothetical protein